MNCEHTHNSDYAVYRNAPHMEQRSEAIAGASAYSTSPSFYTTDKTGAKSNVGYYIARWAIGCARSSSSPWGIFGGGAEATQLLNNRNGSNISTNTTTITTTVIERRQVASFLYVCTQKGDLRSTPLTILPGEQMCACVQNAELCAVRIMCLRCAHLRSVREQAMRSYTVNNLKWNSECLTIKISFRISHGYGGNLFTSTHGTIPKRK